MEKQGCLGGENISGGTRDAWEERIFLEASHAEPLLWDLSRKTQTDPGEFKQVKHYREATAGDLQGQTLGEDVFPGLSAGKSFCFWEAWCHLTEMLSVFLLRHPLGRLGFSSGALGMMMGNALKLPPSLTPPLASLQINK